MSWRVAGRYMRLGLVDVTTSRPVSDNPGMKRIVAGVAGVLLVCTVAACGDSEPSVEEQQINACHVAILDGLKAPSTAEFVNDEELREWEEGGKSVEIKGSVDSQNGFGAQIRSNFRCIVQTSDLSVTGLSID